MQEHQDCVKKPHRVVLHHAVDEPPADDDGLRLRFSDVFFAFFSKYSGP